MSISVSEDLRERLQAMLRAFRPEAAGTLMQVWLPTDVGLVCRGAPYALGDGAPDGLARFRCVCTEYAFGLDSGLPQGLGLVGRAFVSGQPRSMTEVQRAPSAEFHRLQDAARCGVSSSLCVPLFLEKASTSTPPVGVLELVCAGEIPPDITERMAPALKSVQLTCSRPVDPRALSPGMSGATTSNVTHSSKVVNGRAVEREHELNTMLGFGGHKNGAANGATNGLRPNGANGASNGANGAGFPHEAEANGHSHVNGNGAAAADSSVARDRVCSIPLETLAAHFCYNLEDAAKRLGVCRTKLKQVCRTYGIARWPKRAIQKHQRRAERGTVVSLGDGAEGPLNGSGGQKGAPGGVSAPPGPPGAPQGPVAVPTMYTAQPVQPPVVVAYPQHVGQPGAAPPHYPAPPPHTSLADHHSSSSESGPGAVAGGLERNISGGENRKVRNSSEALAMISQLPVSAPMDVVAPTSDVAAMHVGSSGPLDSLLAPELQSAFGPHSVGGAPRLVRSASNPDVAKGNGAGASNGHTNGHSFPITFDTFTAPQLASGELDEYALLDDQMKVERGSSCYNLEAAISALHRQHSNQADGDVGPADVDHGPVAAARRGQSCHGLEMALSAMHSRAQGDEHDPMGVAGAPPRSQGAFPPDYTRLPGRVAGIPEQQQYVQPVLSMAMPSGGSVEAGQDIYGKMDGAGQDYYYCHSCGERLRREGISFCHTCGTRQ
mmetsp:Transcript_21810/g.74125  ORF Transcript_21810/g.74125 Transcript_21810/m.74125 type:complete len:719 (-) Transcript_21810:974-3130(-)